MFRHVLCVSALTWAAAGVVWGQVSAVSVVSSSLPGPTFVNASAALGVPPAVVFGGAVTPFSPPYGDAHIVVIRPGGELTLRLGGVIPAGVNALGVFSNIGVIDVSPDGSGVAGTPAGAFSPFPRALVSVSADGVSFVPVDSGPITFSHPTNRFLDVAPWTGYSPLPGTVESNVYQPWGGSFAELSGLNYTQMLGVFGGSAGGTWLDLSGTGLAVVEYVRFEVPAGADYRMILDAVTGVIPEPGAAGVVLAGLGMALAGRRRRPGSVGTGAVR